ncbi:MAG TPA: arylesterase [Oligoflexia bacterium]|nr:arylesterase [Oligoflexia bacterium]HMP49050.1 arylesterase [Oligoflexia bacterium]
MIVADISKDSDASPNSPESLGRIIFLGDSLTAGYGLSEQYSYPSLIEKKLRFLGLNYEVINAGISGDTTAGGLRRIKWLIGGKPSPANFSSEQGAEVIKRHEVLVIALGANDGLRGFDPLVTKENLRSIILLARSELPGVSIILLGMKAPPNMGEDYTNKFDSIFKELADEYGLPFLPFLLEGVAARAEFNLPDGIHPNESGYEEISENVWQVLSPVLDLGKAKRGTEKGD